MNEILKDIMNTNIVKGHNGKITKLHSNIEFDQGFFLQKLIQEIQAERSLETGLAYGISALFICDALTKTDKTCHIVVDPYQFTDWGGMGVYNLKMAGYDNVIEFYNQSSHIVLPQLEIQNKHIDFGFIDGCHAFDYALLDFFYIDRILRIGGVIVIDDANMRSIKKLSKYILNYRNYTLIDYWGNLKGSPKRITNKLIKILLIPFLNMERLEYFLKLGIYKGIRCLAFRKTQNDRRNWKISSNF